MRKNEQRLWDRMKSNKPRSFWGIRVENIAGAGFPDVYCGFTFGKRTLGLELKAPDEPVRSSTPYLGNSRGVNRDQRNWHVKNESVGGRSYILITGATSKELFLVPGDQADFVNDMSREDLDEYFCRDWTMLFELLRSVCFED